MHKIFPFILVALITAGGLNAAPSPVQTVRIQLPSDAGNVARHGHDILARVITQRCAARIVDDGTAGLRIALATDVKLEAEAFVVADDPGDGVRITGGSGRGLIYGIGKFLHGSRFDQGGFTPGTWRGTSAPTAPVRGIYLASHFNNYYEAAPIAEVQEYVDDLALWGLNYVEVTFPRWQFKGFDDPAAQHALARLRQLLAAAQNTGMQVALLVAANDGFSTSPREFWRTPVPDPLHRRGNARMNLCPANPGAHAMLLRDWGGLLDQFSGVHLDAVEFWPYDEGGCGCKDCWPWGARGFPKLCHDLAGVARDKIPCVKVIVSTWKFDLPDYGEFAGLDKYLRDHPGWTDYIMSDDDRGFPRYPLDHGVPGGLPLLDFPEISMWGQEPWGGYGANPLPDRLQWRWNETKGRLAGGFPYSEGIYEDINMVVCTQLYWDGNRPTTETVRDYAAYEFSPDVADDVARAIKIMESNHDREKIGACANEAWRLIGRADARLTPQVRRAWRWRILYLRALIDHELLATKGELKGETLKQAFQELTDIYYAANSFKESIRPPVIP